MKTPKMTIGQIRDLISGARWLRNDLVGGTPQEFRNQQVGPRLQDKIEMLQALVIPARFVEDIARRNEEIVYCRTVIARWELRRAEYAKTPEGIRDAAIAARWPVRPYQQQVIDHVRATEGGTISLVSRDLI